MNFHPYRIEKGGRINRSSTLHFTFDGRKFSGYKGDTLASALLANGITLVGRSFKYHRPRGIYTSGVEEPNAFIALRDGSRHEPNTLATTVELYDGLHAHSQNRWPSLSFDLQSINGLFHKFIQAGFYYKTFMGPTRNAWLFYERYIRKAAGMGVPPLQPDPDLYERANIFCDVLVVGAGPSGLMAALTAGRSGAKVVLAEDDYVLGGSLLARNKADTDNWLEGVVSELESMSNVSLMKRTTVFGAYDNLTFGLVERVEDHIAVPRNGKPRQRYWKLKARQAILATGMLERPVVFGNNDLPGVMLASAARTYLNRFGISVGRNVIAYTNNDSIYDTVLDLSVLDIDITVIDVRENISETIKNRIIKAGVQLYLGHSVVCAKGRNSIKGADIIKLNSPEVEFSLSCDALLISGGWTPTLHLLSQRGPKPVYDDKLVTLVADSAPEDYHIVGGAAAEFSLNSSVMDSVKKANAAIEKCGFGSVHLKEYPVDGLSEEINEINIVPLWEAPNSKHSRSLKKFVDLQNDVTTNDINLAKQEGYDSVELLKRYTTLGMAPDQGKTSNLNGLGILSERHNRNIKEVGTTTFRPPYRPISIGVIAGRETGAHFRPKRFSPMHEVHVKNGAVLTQTGLWLRPWYFPRDGEDSSEAGIREAENVRKNVGMVDISSLGKIDVQGPDTAEFLNRIYVNNWDSLQIGKAKYGVMLRPDGIVMDDGTTSRLSDDHYFLTTTTTGAGHVMTHLEYLLQVAWPDLKVHVTSVTSQWAAMAVAGPRSKQLLTGLVSNIDFDNASFPFMGVAHGHINNIPVRLLRVSFSGEMAYEIYTPAGYGEQIWKVIYEAGKTYSLEPYGTEALGVLRIEKGHVAGPEIDGRTTLTDLGLGKMGSKKNSYIGSTLMQREGLTEETRPQLVGLEAISNGEKLRAGSVLCEIGIHTGHGIGHITSVTYSPELKKHIGLGFVSGGSTRTGEQLDAVFPLRNEVTAVRVTSPHFVDPDGKRLND